MLAKSLLQVKILAAEVRPLGKKAGQKPGKMADSADKDIAKDKDKDKGKSLFELSCVVTNEGFLPTALKMADRVKIVRPDRVEVKLPAAAEPETDFKAKIEIGHLKSNEKKSAGGSR